MAGAGGAAGFWCVMEGCGGPVERAGFKLCKSHRAEQRAGKIVTCPKCKTYYHRNLGKCPVPHLAAAPPPPMTTRVLAPASAPAPSAPAAPAPAAARATATAAPPGKSPGTPAAAARPAAARPAAVRPAASKAPAARAPAAKAPAARAAPAKAPAAPAADQTATTIGGKVGLSPRRVNLVLAELGWIKRLARGWKPTERGAGLGGVQKTAQQSGIPYVAWPAGILKNKAFVAAANQLKGATVGAPVEQAPADPWGNEPGAEMKVLPGAEEPTEVIAMDGHVCRSRGELLIDNFLYLQGIAHARDRRLPVEEEEICDFYLPATGVCLEFWGTGKVDGAERRSRIRELCKKHKIRLLEIEESQVATIDEEIAKQMLQYGIDCA